MMLEEKSSFESTEPVKSRSYFDRIHDFRKDVFGKIDRYPFGMIIQMPFKTSEINWEELQIWFSLRENRLNTISDVIQMRSTE